MQSQVISETKYRKTRQTQLKCSVFATSNSTKKILDPLLSRFVVIHVKRYSYEEFKGIAMKVLTKRENVKDVNFAITIIDEVWKNMGEGVANLRDTIKIDRLADNMHDVRMIVRTVMSADSGKL
jgi:hypothetical protein